VEPLDADGRVHLDTTRLTHDTGFAPTFDVATAVADYVAWRADNPR
jgi:nucleoside-diphosphate-sugar epimerase